MKHRQTDLSALPVLRGPKTGYILVALLLAVTMFFFVFSIAEPDKTVSEQENRKLASRPSFSVSSLFSGDYTSDAETYWSDTFPLRNFFLDVNSGISKVTSRLSFGSDDVVVVRNDQKDDFGGQSLHEVTSADDAKGEG